MRHKKEGGKLNPTAGQPTRNPLGGRGTSLPISVWHNDLKQRFKFVETESSGDRK